MTEKIVEKLLSGRFWLTIIAGIILVRWGFLAVEGLPEKVIDKLLNIVELVVIFYFLRQDRKPEGGENA